MISNKTYLRKPQWLKVSIPGGQEFNRVKEVLENKCLHSVCREARCPNITECFQSGTATFLIMGNICTRNCLYCNISHGIPEAVDESEVLRLVEAVKCLDIRYIVITSVTRDDLFDGGASQYTECIERIRGELPGSKVEVLIPDLMGNKIALNRIIKAKPDVINHNIEATRSLFKVLRPAGDYKRSLMLLNHIYDVSEIVTKSGFMVGFGESMKDIEDLLADLAKIHCRYVTVGQYQQPTEHHWPIKKYYSPDEFGEIKKMALDMGFSYVEAGPLVRSSYHASKIKRCS